jgi:hypothetical protein
VVLGKLLKGKYHCSVDLLFYWFGLVCFANKNNNFHTADSKPIKREVNGTVILPPLVFYGLFYMRGIAYGIQNFFRAFHRNLILICQWSTLKAGIHLDYRRLFQNAILTHKKLANGFANRNPYVPKYKSQVSYISFYVGGAKE